MQCCLTFVSRLRFLTVDSSESFIWLVSDLYKHSLGYWVVWGRGHLRNGDYCSESSITKRLPFRHGGSTQTVRRRRLIKRESGSSGRAGGGFKHTQSQRYHQHGWWWRRGQCGWLASSVRPFFDLCHSLLSLLLLRCVENNCTLLSVARWWKLLQILKRSRTRKVLQFLSAFFLQNGLF